MVRECNPPARDPASSWLLRRSTMATSTPASASSAASMSPVGPPPAITTEWRLTMPLFPSLLCESFRIQHSHRDYVDDYAARPEACRKPPAAVYTGSGEEGASSPRPPWTAHFTRNWKLEKASFAPRQIPPLANPTTPKLALRGPKHASRSG